MNLTTQTLRTIDCLTLARFTLAGDDEWECYGLYPSALYEELFAGWRRIEVDVPLYGARDTKGQRRTECLWMSYPESESFAGIETAKRNARQPSLGGIL